MTTLGKHWKISENAKKKISIALKGIKRSQETKNKISLAKKGQPSHRKGKHLTAIHKKRIGLANKGKVLLKSRGKNNYRWKGGYINVLFHNARRRVRKKKAEGWHSFNEWLLLKKRYGFTCPACGIKEPEVILGEDHIIPLSKGGSDYIENIQPLCGRCNSKKYTKIIKYKEYKEAFEQL